MAFVYETGAKKRISQFGAREIIAFLEEIPPKYRETVFSSLRPIPGFRKNETTELKKRIEILGASLAQAFESPHRATERDWNALGVVWSCWGENNFEGRTEAVFKKYREEKLSFQDFLGQILGEEENLDVSIEDIGKIFLFSPFDSMDEVDDLIKNFPPRKELEKKRVLAKMPAEIAELKTNISTLTVEFQEQKKSSVPKNSDDIEKIRSEINSLKARVENFEKRCQVIEELSVSQSKTLSQTLDILSRGNEILTKKISANEARATTSEKSATETAAAFKMLEGAVKGLQKAVSEHDKEHGRRKYAGPDQNIADTTTKLIGVETHRPIAGESIVKVDGQSGLLNALTNNYMAVGIAESAAKKTALSVSVAVISGQLVQISGSLADTVADATLSATSGDSHSTWNVPAGLCDTELTAAVVRNVTDSKQPLRGLLLRGLNKSAFDIYGFDIRRIVVNRLLGIGNQHLGLTLAATWLGGNSSLPERDSLAELGPIIDTDALAWTRPKGKLIRYSLPLNSLHLVTEEKSSVSDLSELSEQLSELPIFKSELWRRSVRSALKDMSAMPGVDEADATESLLLNWVFPWAVIQKSPDFDIGTFFREYIPAVQDNSILMAALDRYSETVV